MSNKGLYKFRTPSWRSGQLSGVFFATADEVASLDGQTLYFGEVLGKHSEVEFDHHPEWVKLITDDAALIVVLEDLDIETGYNPLDYIKDSDDEDAEEG